MRYLNRLILLFVVFLSVGCAARGSLFQQGHPPTEGKALVYIYRPGSFVLGGRDAYFYVANKNVADLSAEGYTQLFLDPGSYELEQKWPIDLIGFKNLKVPLTIKADNTYFYRFYSSGGDSCPVGNICFKWSLQQVSEQEAMSEISQCHFQPPK